MWWSKPKRISFEDTRKTLVTVLKDVRSDWADRIAAVPSMSFSSLLGGMGSFSDLVICQINHHNISSDREPLANELVSCLTSICYVSSKQGSLSADTAVESCGTLGLELTGCRCLACGYAQVNPVGIRSLIAAVQVRKGIREGIANGNPSKALIALWQAKEDSDTIQVVVEQAESSGIHYSKEDKWMRPCRHCGSNDTCVYRWKKDRQIFVPADDNLPLRSMPA